ncbi:SRPBCC domain-containing protein [Uliginosibacterium sp. H1]|uniref:SRPBCC domain-containing protein n=1 Tax=Uliginosibacterium sp. H1 TaxID=3114757 RepID=UPI002E19E3C9|nr:SRPBCC domain-containing protein [Uliginosibacterium sp. H1]
MTADTQDADRSFTHTRVIDAPREQVLAAFTDAARLERWWGPAGFRSSTQHFDARPGGRWQVTLHGPDGSDYPNEYVFLELGVERVVIDHPSATHHFVLTVGLHDDDGRTRVVWHQCFDTAEEKARVAHFVESANEQNLDRLTDEVIGAR